MIQLFEVQRTLDSILRNHFLENIAELLIKSNVYAKPVFGKLIT